MATSATSQTNGKTPSGAEVEKQIEQLREDIATLAQSIGKIGAAKGDAAKARARAAVDDIGTSSADMLAALNDEVADLKASLSGRVRERPFAALGIAAGIGFLAAMIARR